MIHTCDNTFINPFPRHLCLLPPSHERPKEHEQAYTYGKEGNKIKSSASTPNPNHSWKTHVRVKGYSPANAETRCWRGGGADKLLNKKFPKPVNFTKNTWKEQN